MSCSNSNLWAQTPLPGVGPRRQPIGIFDSGVGGLSVWRHVRPRLPHVPLIYVADQAHVPYGPQPAANIRAYAAAITQFLIDRDAAVVVVACNTATAAAVDHLRRAFPDVAIVGMEPAVKPAAARSRSGKIGVLATAGTFESQRYHALLARFAPHCQVFENPCPGLVEQIEAGHLDTAETRRLLVGCLEPMLAAEVDTVILGCTHYPFVQPLVEAICGPQVAIIDPAPAVARQAARVYADPEFAPDRSEPAAATAFFSTAADPAVVAHLEQFMKQQHIDGKADFLPLHTPR